MTEYAPSGHGGSAVTRTMTGYHVGAVLTALLALVLVEPLGWQAILVVGGVAGLLTLPLMWARLPESEAFLAARDGAAPVRASAGGEGPVPRDQHRVVWPRSWGCCWSTA